YPHWPASNQLQLEFVLENAGTSIDPRVLQWEFCTSGDDAAAGIPLSPQDGTANLSKSGNVVFTNLPEFKPTVVDGQSCQWLRCRLMTPIAPSSSPAGGMVRSAHLPTVKMLTIRTQFERKGLSIDYAFVNNMKLDVTKD